MGILTTYVCDCCGGQSTQLTKFETVPYQTTINSWVIRVDNALLCLSCAAALTNAAIAGAAALQGTKQGVQL